MDVAAAEEGKKGDIRGLVEVVRVMKGASFHRQHFPFYPSKCPLANLSKMTFCLRDVVCFITVQFIL